MEKFCIGRFNWIRPLPLAFDDSFSYYEQICNIAYNMDALKSWVEQEIAGIEEPGRAYTDAKIAELKEYTNNQFILVNNSINNAILDYNTKITNLSKTVADNKTELHAEIVALANDTDLKFQQFENYIKDYINSQFIEVRVINYFTGQKVTIQDMFDYLASLHVEDGITYTNLAAKGKTTAEIAALGQTVTNLILHGNTLIV